MSSEGRVRAQLNKSVRIDDDDHDGKGFVCASSEAMYEKVGAVRSMW